MNNSNVQTETSKLLTVDHKASLKLSQAEYEALELMAKVEEDTVDEMILNLLHSCILGRLEAVLPDTTKGSQLIDKLRKEENQVWDEFCEETS